MAEKQGFITVGVDYGMGEGQAHMLEIEADACEAIMHLFMTDCDWMKRKVCEMAAAAYVHSRNSQVHGARCAEAAQQPGHLEH